MVTSRVRIQYAGGNVLAFDQRHTGVATDFTQGLGELITATFAGPGRDPVPATPRRSST